MTKEHLNLYSFDSKKELKMEKGTYSPKGTNLIL